MSPEVYGERSRTRRVVLLVLAAVVLVVVGCAVWVGVRTSLAANELDAAIPIASNVQDELLAGDGDSAAASIAELSKRTGAAVDLTSDPLYGVAKALPLIGPNLSAFRQIAESVHSVARDGLIPLTPIAGTVDSTSLRPVAGAIDLAPLIKAAAPLERSREVLQRADDDVAAIDTSATLPQITAAVDRLSGLVSGATTTVTAAANTAVLLPAMLGASEDRTYLLVFQNNAEVRATGGLPGALALVETSGGRVALGTQAAAADFRLFDAPVAPLDAQTEALYGDQVARRIQSVNLTPDFPTSAALASQMWRLQFGNEVDGVVAVDPVLLGYLLEAAGPVTLPTGEVIGPDNAVSFFLSEVYLRYPDPAVQDVVFAEAARLVFDKITSGDVDSALLLEEFQTGVEERRILIWNSRAGEQAVLEDTEFAGSMPASNEAATVGGVFLNDVTAGKMDYYLEGRATVFFDSCEGRRDRTWRTEIELSSSAPADAGATLPAYVTGGVAAQVPRGTIRTQVTVYGPVGSTVEGVEVDGSSVEAPSIEHFGRGVAQLVVDLAPGEQVSISIDSRGSDLPVGPASLRMTPLIAPPKTEVTTLPC